MSIFDPIAALETAFGSIFNSIAQAIASIPGQVIAGVTNAITSSISFVSSTLASIPGQIYNQLLNIKDQILGGLAGIPGKVAGLLGGIETAVANSFSGFSNQVLSIFNGIFAQIRNFITPSLNLIQTNFAQGFGLLQNTVNGLPGYINGLIADTKNRIADLGKNLTSQIQADITFAANLGAGLTAGLNNLGSQVSSIGAGVNTAFQNLASFGSQIFTQFTAGAQQFYNATFRPVVDGFTNSVKSVADLLANFGKGLQNIQPSQAVALASTAGAAITTILAARWGIDSVVKAASFGQVSVLDKQLTELLESIGIVGLGAKFNLAPIDYGILPLVKRGWQSIFTPNVPGPSEILEMADRGAFNGQGLIRAPAETLQFIRENGLSSEWADRLWSIHFQPLNLNQLADALHRKFIGAAEYARRLDLLQIYPQDKTLVQMLAFTFPGIRQMRALTKMGLLTESQITDAVDASGLREDFRKPFIQSLQEGNIIPLLDRTDAAAIGAYEDFLIGDSDLSNLLQQSRKPKTIIDQEIKLARFRRDLAFRKAQIQVITTLLKKGIKTPAEALQSFLELGLDTERASLITSLAQYELDAATNKKVRKVAPDLSVSQIQKALKIGDISTDDAFAAFTARGYDSNEARTLVELTYGADTVPVLSVAQILAAMKKSVITMQDGAARIIKRGYSVLDTSILIATAFA